MALTKKHITELTTRELDYAVGIAEGLDVEYLEDFGFYGIRDKNDPIAAERIPAYSSDWWHGGPLIEKYDIWLCHDINNDEKLYTASTHINAIHTYDMDIYEGRTALVSICRAVLAAKLGEYVEVPDDVNGMED